ncbi:protein FAM50A-like [Eucalyptus grandis]|uniref:protein FAM50A-like n=1 Tax=Eucalyptus grandis TaxID=71139 RepID=UPI00192ED355|nr:protein FAM50A-like [Eucalyptus grandis]
MIFGWWHFYLVKETGLQGQMMQLTMMAMPMMNKELHYLNREDGLLRWLLVMHRDTNYGLEFLTEEDEKRERSRFPRSSLFDDEDADKDVDDDEDDDDDDEYEVDREKRKEE